MSSHNHVTILGNLGRDPELRELPNGGHVADLSVATSYKWKDDTGRKVEETEWHSVQVWGPAAVACAEYLRSGSQVLVSGRLRTERWKDRDSGEDRFRTRIVADTRGGVVFCGTPPASKRGAAS